MLSFLDGGDVPKKKRAIKPAAGRQEIAFTALQNLLIDRNEKQVHYDDWKGSHERNSPMRRQISVIRPDAAFRARVWSLSRIKCVGLTIT